MDGQSSSRRRVAVNTSLLYFRMLLLMFISLYTSRVILKELGFVDFGIYNVVGGIVAMFSLISGSLTSAITRFLTFNLGKGDLGLLQRTFSTALNIQFVLSVLIIILGEPIGLWFIENKMSMPTDRYVAATWVFHASLLTFAVNLISIPYNAAIIAHERMKVFAYISILEAVLKLSVVFLLSFFADRLIAYAVLVLITSVVIRFIYSFYCRRSFKECKYRWIFDKELFKNIFSFAGWNFVGTSSAILRDHGGNILLNLFFGPVTNAARGITMQVNSAISGFIYNFTTALNPQITKSYAMKNMNYVYSLNFWGTKISFFLFMIIVMPVFWGVDYILDIWLSEVPESAPLFIRLVLVYSLSESMSVTLVTSALATGNIKKYQIIVGGLQALNFPIAYVLFKLGAPHYSIFIVAIVLSQMCFWGRMSLLKNMISFPVSTFIKQVYSRCLLVVTILFVSLYPLSKIYTDWWIQLLIYGFATLCLGSLYVYTLGLNKKERNRLKLFIKSKKSL